MSERTDPLMAQVRADMPSWAQIPLARWDDTGFRVMSDFVTEHYWTGQGSINVYRIVGTDHPQYAGMTWLELLERGKRMDINIPLAEKNPGYYTQAEQAHTGMNFVSLDGINWYVSADGNHRSCLARFCFHLQGEGRTQLHNVCQSVYQVDRVFQSVCGKIHSLAEPLSRKGVYIRMQARHLVTEREDLSGWKVDRSRARAELTVDDGEVHTVVVHNTAEAERELRRLTAMLSTEAGKCPRPWWKRLFSGRRLNHE